MYDLYPEWGPARHDAQSNYGRRDFYDAPRGTDAVQAALDGRDNGGPRPDDN